jgi:RNA polymerase sigma factor (sigma-70 family)
MAAIEPEPSTAGVGDVSELYGLLARHLERIVRLDVRAPDVVIEDACQVAWSRLLHHRHRVRRETALAWLARTAVHEAMRLLWRDRRELSLEAVFEQASEAPAFTSAATPLERIEFQERLADLAHLSERQRRALWLHALGLSYAEIAAQEGCTVRTVERQLLRARAGIRRGQTTQAA